MKLITISEIDSTGPVRAISEGRIKAEDLRQAFLMNCPPKKRARFVFDRVDLSKAPAIVAAARRRGWVK